MKNPLKTFLKRVRDGDDGALGRSAEIEVEAHTEDARYWRDSAVILAWIFNPEAAKAVWGEELVNPLGLQILVPKYVEHWWNITLAMSQNGDTPEEALAKEL